MEAPASRAVSSPSIHSAPRPLRAGRCDSRASGPGWADRTGAAGPPPRRRRLPLPDGAAILRRMTALLWSPSPERVAASRLTAFVRRLAAGDLGPPPPAGDLASYEALHAWSVREPAEFWSAVWRAADLLADGGAPPAAAGDDVVLGLDRMAPPDPERGPRWFRSARLNFAEHLLRRRDDAPAIVAWDERGRTATLSFADLAERVRRCRAALRAEGVGVGDRVAGYLPNVPE